MTTPKINPKTGHEDGLPTPRPRHEIYREMLASHQVDPNTHLFDIYHRLQMILADLQPFVDNELSARDKRK
ncbi:MAG: hypothetical protein K2M34_04345 [Alphaproteobacteria bacterium]|nr:hypothetical protein [Alphaproteobacteria bacterium]